MAKAQQISREAHLALKVEHEATLDSLNRERAQNANLHQQMIHLVQSAVGGKEEAVAN